MQKIKSLIKKIESKKTTTEFSIGWRLIFFLVGFLGLQLVASIIVTFIEIVNKDLIGENISPDLSSLLNFLAYLILTTIMLAIMLAKKDTKKWFLEQFKDKNAILEGLAIGAATIALSMLYSFLVSLIFQNVTENNNQQSIESAFGAQPVLSFFFIVIFAPIVEELTYRFGLFGSVSKCSKILAYIITILVFAFLHFDFEAFKIGGNLLINELINLPAYMIGGLCLSYAYARNGKISTSIVAHSIYNGLQFILMCILMLLG